MLTAMRKSMQAIKPGLRELIVSKQGSQGTGHRGQGEKGGGYEKGFLWEQQAVT